MSIKYISILLFISLLFIGQASADIPTISFIDPTLANASTNNTGSVSINTSVTNATNATALLNWNNSLIGWWRMNEAAGGTLVQDFSGYGNNGTWIGNTTSNVTTGMFGNALAFDGVDDYVNAGNDASLNITKEITISAWIKRNNTGVRQFIIDKEKYVSSTDRQGWLIEIQADNTARFTLENNAGTAITSTETLSVGVWYFIVAGFDATTKYIYINTTKYSNAVGIFPAITSNSLFIGTEDGTSRYFNGSIDEVRIYNCAPSASEINASYNAGLYRLNTTMSNLTDRTYNYTAYVQDAYGTIGQTETRYITVDAVTPPASITGLTNTTGNFWHNWTWTNPTDSDFNYTMIYINGSFATNTSNKYYNLTANAHNQSTISTHTVDVVGNVNTTWVNHTSIIPNNVPANISLLTPINGSTITSIPTNLTWNIGVDNDSDVLTYSLKINGSIVLTGITTNYTSYNLSSGNNNWSVRSYDGYEYSNWSNVYDLRYNLVNFSFTNKSVSETQIYQSSQSTRIRVDVNDSDGYIRNVSVGITLSGVETNYTMTGGNDTWIYDFKSGVTGAYSITHFYATDNESGINSSTSTLQFIVVPVISGGSSAPAPVITPTQTVVPIVTVDIVKPKTEIKTLEEVPIESLKELLDTKVTEFNTLPREMQWSVYAIIFIGLVMYSGKGKKKRRY